MYLSLEAFTIIPLLIEIVFMITSVMFLGEISFIGLLLLLKNFMSEFRLELLSVSLIESSSWFSLACLAAVAHRNLFCLYQQYEPSGSAFNYYKTVLF